MKILGLRFKNINSLAGEWLIDFTSPAYCADGIFAITGPTGSGKSSILDAICLALFGKTPRLNVISASTNEIMSRQTGECFAEVVFATQSGSYRCYWEQHRARGAIDGRLSPPKHEISEADSGKLLASKVREVAALVEEKTGMDYDRFTRSVLLAQGSFAAFLNADSDERSALLEQITGAEIYSGLSLHVHECFTAVKRRLELLQAESDVIQTLTSERIDQLKAAAAEKQAAGKQLGEKSAAISEAMQWRRGIEELQREKLKLDAAAQELKVRLQEFLPQRQRLAMAQQATELQGIFAQLDKMRNDQRLDMHALAECESQREGKEQKLAQSESELKVGEEKLLAVREAQKVELMTVAKVRSIDEQLSEHKKAMKRIALEIDGLNEKILADKEKGLIFTRKKEQAEKKLEDLRNYLIKHIADAALITEFTGLKEQAQSIRQLTGQKKVSSEQLEQASKKLQQQRIDQERHQKNAEDLRTACAGVRKKMQETGDLLTALLAGRLLREYRADRDALTRELFLLQKINSLELEKERALLEDGRPCILCGSSVHPFAAGNVPEVGPAEEKLARLADFIARAEKLEEQIKELLVSEKAAQDSAIDAERRLEEEKFKQTELQQLAQRLQQELQKQEDQIAVSLAGFNERVAPFGVTFNGAEAVEEAVSALHEKFLAWQSKENERSEIEKQLADLTMEIRLADAGILAKSGEVTRSLEAKDAVAAVVADLHAERFRIYGEKNPDVEEERCGQAVAAAERFVETARRHRDECRRQNDENNTLIVSLTLKKGQHETEIARADEVFKSELIKHGFAGETDFVASILSRDEREALAGVAAELDRGQVEIAARRADVDAKLTFEQAKNISAMTGDELAIEYDKLADELKAVTEAGGAIRQQLADDAAARERSREKLASIEAQMVEFNRWAALQKLIGSADGKKFRNFAQGLTFAIVVAHANGQLARMTDRYLLKRDDNATLDLMVVDNYQAGEVRSTRNLSGGESFIVSLALALGLSSMSSRNVRVDSLFLDEGFGTLDDEALESALETLAGLHQEGKLIGIISHVAAIKERISLQINISPQNNGRSILSGPGCSLAG